HVVDLNGSVQGKPVNLKQIKEIARVVRIPVQLGGGVRDETIISMYLDEGVAAVIVGTLAAKDPERTIRLIRGFPGRVAVGIDARTGYVAVEGWTESTTIKATDLARRLEAARPAAFIYTDIDRDGMMNGPNVGATKEFAASTSIPVILSGGVSSYADLEAALPLEKDGVVGIIIGRALYEGTIELREAIRLVEGRNAG
ncbi:MAG: 1-(5-phosphoribosyl)-5-((5-phosphoribosylamino)methylideneamino)imidazole-4-carboxamide isomerase, partial [Deltaproteobacteria bacterium]|nr:1-(5-phosphoribosyl)-5-((5-phosphoribosylamino)methylideneamino)imidazole-4-carboxamide isomerase [Deltaproteobacteria bacterium]